MRVTIHLMMMGMMTHKDRLPGGEPAKETEEDHIRHPEEEEISPALHPDRRVSLMVWRVMQLLRSYPHWRNVSKSRRDRLLHQSPLSRIPLKSFLGSRKT